MKQGLSGLECGVAETNPLAAVDLSLATFSGGGGRAAASFRQNILLRQAVSVELSANHFNAGNGLDGSVIFRREATMMCLS